MKTVDEATRAEVHSIHLDKLEADNYVEDQVCIKYHITSCTPVVFYMAYTQVTSEAYTPHIVS
jgi:hypothetical protein